MDIDTNPPSEQIISAIGRSEIHQGTRANFNQSIICYHHVKDNVEIGYLTKFDLFRVNIDQVMDLEIWFKIHTNVSNFETASSKTT